MEKDRLIKLIDLLKSLKGKKPDMEHLDFSRYNLTEEEYQKEQAEWMKKVKLKKTKKKKG